MNRLRVFILLIILSFSASCATVPTEDLPKKAEGHYKLGVAYLNENKPQQAFVEFQQAYEMSPNNRGVLNGIGILYLLYFDDTPKAIEFFEKAVKVSPDFSDAYNNLGFAHEKLGNYETAITFYKKALSNLKYVTADKAYINMGNSYYRMGKYELALNAYKEALRRDPGSSLGYLRMSLVYNAMRKYGDAAASMAQAIALDPYYKGNKEKAIEDLSARKLKAPGYEEQDYNDYLEILKY